MKSLTELSINYPKTTIWISVVITLLFLSQFPGITIDTDPENMLSEKEWVRVYHNQTKKTFSINDYIVIGFFNPKDPAGMFNPESLSRIAVITEEVLDIKGVVIRDMISPTTVDDIWQHAGMLSIDRLQKGRVESEEEAAKIRRAALSNPLFKDKLISKDGKALALYVPIVSKDQSYRIAREIRTVLRKHLGPEQFYITGLPVAEDTFGFEMFKQMGISSPVAFILVLILIYVFIRKVSLTIAPMVVAVFAIVWSMGGLIGLGYTVHIMSSMIPIFLIPISVDDSVHMLSHFSEIYQRHRDKKKAIVQVVEDLWSPMLYTTLTTMAGFASLALTPIPPVRVFGAFICFGKFVAWLLTMTVIPAIVMLLNEEKLKTFGATEEKPGMISRATDIIGNFAVRKQKIILTLTFLLLIIGTYGLSRIVVNDNPVKWFSYNHNIRVSDRLLNNNFGGTYMAYLVFEGSEEGAMKNPEVVKYIEVLQRHLESLPVVGKTSSVADIIKKIAFEIHDGDKHYDAVPDSREAIAQYLFLYQNSGDPQDLFRYISYDGMKANIWIQMKKGDNQDMTSVEKAVDGYIEQNPLPGGVKLEWAGLTYLNVVWQDKMVKGMFSALMGSFAMVFIMMLILFRSIRWGILSMIPLSFSILLIYGIIGLVGKNYDMPVAVLSALTLGLSIDYAIHFIQRSRMLYTAEKGWRQTLRDTFSEPARAILKNAIIVSLAFLPLLFATLVPYKTVGAFLACIIALSGAATLLLIPSIIAVFGDALYEKPKALTLDRAFRLAVGVLILVSLLAGRFMTPYAYLLGALVCFGLIQSAFTGFCLLKVILKKSGLKEE
jgi:hypothetical protein